MSLGACGQTHSLTRSLAHLPVVQCTHSPTHLLTHRYPGAMYSLGSYKRGKTQVLVRPAWQRRSGWAVVLCRRVLVVRSELEGRIAYSVDAVTRATPSSYSGVARGGFVRDPGFGRSVAMVRGQTQSVTACHSTQSARDRVKLPIPVTKSPHPQGCRWVCLTPTSALSSAKPRRWALPRVVLVWPSTKPPQSACARAQVIEPNYPENLGHCVIINAPW